MNEKQIPMSAKCYAAAIVCESRIGERDTAWVLLRQVLSKGWRISREVFHSYMKACVACHKDASAILSVLQLVEGTTYHVKTSKTFEILLECCKSRRDLETLLDEMRRSPIIPNSNYWLAMIRLADVWDTGNELYEILDYYNRTSGRIQNADVWNELITHLARRNKFHGALNYLERALKERISIYRSTHCALLRCLTRTKLASEGHIWQWWWLLLKYAPKKATRLPHKVFRRFLDALVSKGDVDSIKAWFCLISSSRLTTSDMPASIIRSIMRIHNGHPETCFNYYQLSDQWKLTLVTSLIEYGYFEEALDLVNLISLEYHNLFEACYIRLWNSLRTRKDVSKIEPLLRLMIKNRKWPSESVKKAVTSGFARLLPPRPNQESLYTTSILVSTAIDMLEEASNTLPNISYPVSLILRQSCSSKSRG